MGIYISNEELIFLALCKKKKKTLLTKDVLTFFFRNLSYDDYLRWETKDSSPTFHPADPYIRQPNQREDKNYSGVVLS